MRILLAGGGTGGPVGPVLAVALKIKSLHPQTTFLFVGTRQGPERGMVEGAGFKFVSIPATRLRRFVTLKNLFAPFVFTYSLLRAYLVIKKFQPDVFFSAGGFVAVPLAWIASWQKVRIVIHQQDAKIGLANKLIAPLAAEITTAFEHTSKKFYSGSGIFNDKLRNVTWVGNPIRPELYETSKVDVKKYFNLHDELPILLVWGGATGAEQINNMIAEILPDLVTAHQVIHQTGKGKNKINFQHRNYHAFELIPYNENMAILKKAHLVVARAGLASISELSALGKPAIIIPMPRTHQEENAKILLWTHSALVLMGEDATSSNLKQVIHSLKFNQKRVEMMQKNISQLFPKDAAEKLAKIILKL